MKRVMAAALSAVMGLSILAGCGGGGSSDTDTSSANAGETSAATGDAASDEATEESSGRSTYRDADIDKPADGQYIIQGIEEDPDTLDPTLCNYANSSFMINAAFGGLFRLDEDNKAQPLYCKDYTVSDDGLKYTFTLVDDAKWSDGTPLTAGDFEYAWKRVANPEVASRTAFSSYVLKNGQAISDGSDPALTLDDLGVKAVDDKTLEVELQGPTTYFIDLLATVAFYPVKKDSVEAADAWTKSAATYVSNGPFKMAQMAPGEKYVLVKNENYVKADEVKLEQLIYQIIPSQDSQQYAFMSNEIDVTSFLPQEAYEQYKESGEYHTVPRLGLYFIDFQTEHKPFDDARVRKALAMSIDRQAIITSVIQGDYQPAFGFVPLGIPDPADPSKSYREVAGDLFQENVEEAQKLLADAGYPNGEGFPTFTFITLSAQTDKDIAQAMQEMWRTNLGIECEIQQYESKVYWDMHSAGDFDIARDGFTGDVLDPIALLEANYSEKQKTETRWSNAEYDKLLDDSRLTTDQNQRMEYFLEAEKIWAEDMPNFSVYYYNAPYVSHNYVKDVWRNALGTIYYDKAYTEGR